jgi:hypothetical protein
VNVSSVVDPIILDLGAHGVSLANTVLFDMDGDGHAQGVSWTNGQDGILAMDLNGNGQIDSGKEVFSPFFGGGNYAHALEALATLDSNGDGVLDSSDSQFANLKVWVDANSDGVTDAGELLSLSDLGITSINLSTVAGSGSIDGQNVLADGTFAYADGSTGDFSAVELTESANIRVFTGQGNESMVGTEGDDILLASYLGNSMSGGGGNDTLYGNTGDNVLDGGDGNDMLVAGSGTTTMTGGAGNDTFAFSSQSASNGDSITDFSAGDKLDFSAISGDLVAAGEQGLSFGGTTATAHGVWYAEVGNDTYVYVDTDGNSSTAELAIKLLGQHALSASDLIL